MATYVEFEYRPVQDAQASAAEGRAVFKDHEYIVLLIDDKTQIPLRWDEAPPYVKEEYRKNYESWKAGEEAPLEGTSLRDWPAISKAQAEEMWQLGIRTLEDLIAAPDPLLDRAGSGARALQGKARAWLDTAADTGKVAEEVKALRDENAALRAEIADLKQLVKAPAARKAPAKKSTAKKTSSRARAIP